MTDELKLVKDYQVIIEKDELGELRKSREHWESESHRISQAALDKFKQMETERDETNKALAVALEDKRIVNLMLIRACDDVEKCFTSQEWQVAHDEVWDGGNQGWGSVARHAISNLRNQPDFAAGRDAVIDYLQTEDFHIANSDYKAMKALEP